MAGFKKRRLWDSQPQEAVEFFGESPLFHGVAFVIAHGPGGRRELVRNLGIASGTSTHGISSAGVGDKYSAAGQWTTNALVTSNGAGTGDFTLLSFSAPVAESDATALLSSANGVGGQQAYLLANCNTGYGASSGTLTFGTADNATTVLMSASSVIDAAPHVFVAVRAAGVGYIDVDGVQKATAAMSPIAVYGSGVVIQVQGINGYTGWTSSAPGPQLVEIGWNRALTAAERVLVGDPAWLWGQIYQPKSIWIPAAAAGGAYTITADAGAYTLAGQDATLLKTRIVTADAGSYAVSGQDASVLVGHLITADAGAYSVAGQDATLTYVPVTPGAYTLTCDAGAYALAGQDATLLRGRVVAADAGSYITTGQDSTFIYAGAVTYAANANLYLGIGSELSIVLGGPRMPFWATAGRPTTPLNGIYGFNTDTNAIEVWTGSAWV